MNDEMIVMDTPEKIGAYRLCALKASLKLEMRGLKRHGRSASSMLRDLGIKGNRERQLRQLEALIEKGEVPESFIVRR